jgi:DNA polymerase III delta prime subunit
MPIDFYTWKSLLEGKDTAKSRIQTIVDFLEKREGDKVFFIDDFEEIRREGEPNQKCALLFTKAGKSVRLNFTQSGQLYSADFWKPSSKKPVATAYFKEKTIEEALPILTKLFHDPEMQRLEESNEVVQIVRPKQESEANDAIKNAEKKLKKKYEGDYELQDPETIFEDMKEYINMVVDGKMYAAVFSGQPGTGKSYRTKKYLEERGLKKGKDFIWYKARATAVGLYKLLYENRDKIIVLDDLDSVHKDTTAINVLAGVLDTQKERTVDWQTGPPVKDDKGELIPRSFTFVGKVFFLTNYPLRKIDPKLISRCFKLEIAFSREDMIQLMWSIIDDLQSAAGEPIATSIKERAMELLSKASSEEEEVELSLRTLIKAAAIIETVGSNEETALRMIAQQCRS